MAEVTLRHEGPSPKTLDSDENLRPNLRHFVAILKFVAIFALFLKTLGMKVFFGSNTVFFWARGVLLHGIFAYYDDDSLFLYCKFKGSSNSDIYYTWQVLSTHLGPYKALNPNT